MYKSSALFNPRRTMKVAPRPPNLGKYSSFRAYSKGILKTSLITSFPEISATRSLPKRLLKILVFVICTVGFLYQTLNFLKMYLAYPTVVNVHISYPFLVDQPGITICNRNLMRRTYVCDMEGSNCNLVLPELFCDLYPMFCPGNLPQTAYTRMPYMNDIVESDYYWPFIKEVAHNGSMYSSCYKLINNKRVDCEKSYLAVPAVSLKGEPNYCYSVESQWGEPDAKPNVYANFFDIKMQLLTEPHQYLLHSSPITMVLALHDRKARVNPYVDGITLSGGLQYIAHVSMISTERLPYPYDTNCTDYLELWKNNNGTGPLNEMMCVEQCKMNKLLENDTCVDKTVAYPHEEHLCNKDEIKVTSEILQTCYLECGKACYDHSYEIRLEDIDNFDHICNARDVWCKHQRIKLDFNFLRFRHTKYSYQAKFASVEMFSYVGGYMGMWLGLSLISLFDLFETICFLLFYPIGRMTRKRQKNTKTPIKPYGRGGYYDNLPVVY